MWEKLITIENGNSGILDRKGTSQNLFGRLVQGPCHGSNVPVSNTRKLLAAVVNKQVLAPLTFSEMGLKHNLLKMC
jgi:hypothetical protein